MLRGNIRVMTKPGRFLATAILALAILASGCKEDAPVAPAPVGPESWFPFTIGGVAVKLQVVHRPLELVQGLMHRTTLGEHEGMLFVYPRPGVQGFWMRNTVIPLDIGFFSPDGTLREVHAMNPLDENRVTSFSSDVQFAIEMNQGWYRANGVKPGAKLDMAAVREALKARGVDPRTMGVR